MAQGKLTGWTILITIPLLFYSIYYLTDHYLYPLEKEMNFPIIPEKFKGRQWMAVFVKTACPTCHKLLGDLSRLLQHHPSANLPLLVLSLDSPQHIFHYQSLFSIPFTIYACNSYLTQPLGVNVVPDIFLIDAEGNVKNRWKGSSILTAKPILIRDILFKKVSWEEINVNSFDDLLDTCGCDTPGVTPPESYDQKIKYNSRVYPD